MILNLTPHPIRFYANEREDGIDDLAQVRFEVVRSEEHTSELQSR